MGPRLTGTAAYRRAAEWTADELRAAGVDRVELEPFSIADGWERERASAQIVAPVARTLRVAALGWTPSTPADGLEAEVVAVSELAPEKIAALRSLDGRIVLLPAGDVGGNPSTVTRRRRELDVALRDAGARAILSPDADRDNALTARDRTFGATLGALPAAQIGRGDADAIRRLLDRGPVRIALDLRNRITPGPVTVHNVIGEIRGREYPEQWAIVGVAFDSSMRYAFQSDGAPFIRAGIPLLDLNADDSTYEDIHHKDTDTIERVDARNLAIGAAIVATTAFAVADAPVRIADRVRRIRN